MMSRFLEHLEQFPHPVFRTYPETTCGLCDTPLGPPSRGELKGGVRCRGRFLDRLLGSVDIWVLINRCQQHYYKMKHG
jgi:hypothetical protein